MNFRSKIWARHSLRWPRFPIRQMHFHYRVTLLDIFDVFVLLRRITLWPWPLTFWPWECFVYSASHVWPTYQFLLSYDYRLLSYEYWISDHITFTWNIHCACAVSRDLLPGAKMIHIFGIPEHNLPIDFVTFTVLRRRLSHVIGENGVFPLWRLKSLLRMCSITWPVHRGSPKTTRNNFLTPNCLFTIQLLWGYDDD